MNKEREHDTMTTDHSENRLKQQQRQDMPPQDQYEELSLIDLIITIWRYRVTLLVSGFLIGVLILAFTGLHYANSGKEQSQFLIRLDFLGIEKNQYPNGLRFSPADMTAPAITSEIYRNNNLAQYFPTERDFMSRLVVLKATRGLEILEQNYLSAMSDKKLTAEERQKLKAKYDSERDAILKVPEFSIILDPGDKEVPQEVQHKVLEDLVKTWTEYCRERKGIFEYQIPLLTGAVLKIEDSEDEEYIILADILRTTINRTIDQCDKVAELPGAELVKVPLVPIDLETMRLSDEEGPFPMVNLHTLRVRLQDTIMFKHRQLVAAIRSTGAVKKPDLVSWYLENQLDNVALELAERNKRMDLLKQAINGYADDESVPTPPEMSGENPLTRKGSGTTLIPQIGDNFLNSLIELANDSQDYQYRQEITQKIIEEGNKVAELEKEVAYYTDMKARIERSQAQKSTEDARQKYIPQIKAATATIQTETLASLHAMEQIYNEISTQHLRPEARMYSTIEPPSTVKVRSTSLKKLLMVQVAIACVLMAMIGFACLVHDRIKHGSDKKG